jgi:hypothetical protein
MLVRFVHVIATAAAFGIAVGGSDAVARFCQTPTAGGAVHAALAALARPEELAAITSQLLPIRPVPAEQASYQLKHGIPPECLR